MQRSLVVVVSDFRGPRDWKRGLLRVAARHATLAVEIRDPREQELADVGELHLVDPETGRQLLVDTGDPVVREQFAEAAAEDRRELVAMLTSAGVPHVALSTEGDWLRRSLRSWAGATGGELRLAVPALRAARGPARGGRLPGARPAARAALGRLVEAGDAAEHRAAAVARAAATSRPRCS